MHFRGKYWFLSNFYPCKINAWEIEFPTLEHAYVACKTNDLALRRKIAKIATPGKAKKFGRTFTPIPDWDRRKVHFMRVLLKRKFSDKTLARQLLAVKDPIVEDNKWGDTFWGKYNGKGMNMLGRLLTEVRDGIREERE